MKRLIFFLLASIFIFVQCTTAEADEGIRLNKSDEGWRLTIDGKPFMVNGVNWDYFPIGTNYEYSLWEESDAFIIKALDNEMSLLREMGINAIRVYTGIQPRWIDYIYENYGIWTMLNHPFGRYGYGLEGEWISPTNYADSVARKILLAEVTQLAQEYKNTSGLLLYLLGNENNYGLFWSGAETEDFPKGDTQREIQARHMYRLFNEGALAIKSVDPQTPVAFCNGDLLFLDIIVEECQDIDIFGLNVYRGKSFTYLFDKVAEEYGKPVLLTEFGSDAFNAITMEEAQKEQALYNLFNWREIYENAAGMGKAENSIGGFTFQFSDGWWKSGQTTDLDVHNTTASWENAGYEFDHISGQNNMNEEWFGICAKGSVDELGFYNLYPRAAFFAQKKAHQFNPYEDQMTIESIQLHFDNINIEDCYRKAKMRTVD